MSYSQLMRSSFEELYEKYDNSRDEDEKQLIKQVVEDKKPPPPDPNFQPYPQLTNPEFQKILFEKKEFNSNQLFLDSTTVNQCNTDFSIKPHQIVLKNFMNKESPYRSLLVYHGVGVGKTCSGLTIAENFRDTFARKDRRILILCSKNIQIGWKKSIYDPEKGSEQCTGESFTETGANTQREVNKLIKQYYEIMAYQSFSNFVKRKQEEHSRRLPEAEKEQGKLQWIKDYFSDRLVVIDEAHNIRDDQGNELRDVVKTIEEVIRYSDNLRLVLLTATPMYNRSTEIVWMLNMMLLNDKRTPISYNDVFDKQGELKQQGETIIQEKSTGYVSYLRGENPITFPLRLTPKYLKNKNKNPMFPLYSKQHTNSIIFKSNSPSLNLVGGHIKSDDKFKFLELFGSKLKGLQELIYKQSIQNIIDTNENLDLDARGEKNSILDNILLTQITDFVYPVPSKDIKKDLRDGTLKVDDFYGSNGLKNALIRKRNTYAYKDKSYPFFDKDHLGNHSSKMASILDAIDNTEGIVFVYTNYVDSGILPLQLMLEHNGYKRFDKRTVLSFPEYKSSLGKDKCKREPISYNGLRKSESGEDFKQSTFMVIDGSTSKSELSEQLKIVTSKSNSNGERIKVILGTVVASEGLDFKRIRSIHILDPWLHLNRIEQTVGRGIRFCSHADLPDDSKNVLIYLHASTLQSDQETVDTSIYRYAEKKSIQIGIVETILKKNAIDRYLYEDVNVIEKGTLNNVTIKPPIYHSSKIKVDPTDKAYSKVCSYMPDCNYNKNLHINYDVELNKDTFLESYSKNAIQNIKKKISLLFKDFYVFNISSILGLLHEYGFTYDDMIYHALSEMISEKYIIYSKDKYSGYIVNRGNYYIFQPFLYEDCIMPLYYRSNLLQLQKRVLKLDRLTKEVKSPEYSPSYTVDNLRNIYMTSIDEIQNKNPEYTEVIDALKDVYTDVDMFGESVIGYLYDQLSIYDKIGIIYASFKPELNEMSETNYHAAFKNYVRRNLIYKSKTSEEYYFGEEQKYYKQTELFGFFITFQNKPFFYEYYDETIHPCDQVQLQNINKSLKRFKTSALGKTFKKNSPFWGYNIERQKNKTREVVMKFVSPDSKNTKYPPGPGNVCIENNIGSSKQNIEKLIDRYLPELKELFTSELISNKKNICLLLELSMRHNPKFTFYPVDTMWMKHN